MHTLLDLPEFSVKELLYEGPLFSTYRGFKKMTGNNVILKITSTDRPKPEDIERIKKEFSILELFDSPYIIKVQDFIHVGSIWGFSMEDVRGLSLKEKLKSGPIHLELFFQMAPQILEALHVIHAKNVIHKDIKPDNILVLENNSLKLIDFSVAEKKEHEIVQETHPLLEGTLSYIAPEQTGRVNKSIGPPCDFYSLGITFYEMLTGKLPFVEKDSLELIYAHLAKIPPTPEALRPEIPKMLSNLIIKLMDKDPENRYQKADAILYDLDKIEANWKKKDEKLFSLGRHDSCEKLIIPQKLYGREEEVAFLYQFCQAPPRPALFFVEGFPGVGKTAFLEEVLQKLEIEGYGIIKGKNELLKKGFPYSGLIEIIKNFIFEMYLQDKQIQEQFFRELKEILGSDLYLIIEHIPSLRDCFVTLPEAPLLEGKSKQMRFRRSLGLFFSILKKKEKPYVFFFDDIQWADWSTLDWIATDLSLLENIIFIGAYRSDDLASNYALKSFFSALQERGTNFTRQSLQPLNQDILKMYLSDIFNQQLDQKSVEIFFKKTAGNPFFVRQFLGHLHKLHLISYERENQRWNFDREKIEQLPLSTDAADLMKVRMNQLDPQTKDSIVLAALIGLKGSLNLIALIVKKSIEEVISSLEPALSMGLLFFQESGKKEGLLFFFAHDKIQQGAASLLSMEQKEAFHLTILREGREFLDEKELIRHLNSASLYALDKDELTVAADLNRKIFYEAKNAGAYDSALFFIQKAERFYSSFWTWDRNLEDMFSLYKDLATAYFLSLNLEEAENIFKALLEKTGKDPYSKAEIYLLKVDLYLLQDRLQEAFKDIKIALKIFKIDIPDKIFYKDLFLEILKCRFRSFFKDLYQLLPIKDKRERMVARLLAAFLTIAMQLDVKLYIFLCAKNVELLLQHGYTEHILGIVSGSFLFFAARSFKEARRYYDYAFFLNDKVVNSSDWGVVLTLSGGFIHHWFFPYVESIELLKKAILICYEKGQYFYATLAKMFLIYASFRLSEKLSALEDMMGEVIFELSQERHLLFLEIAKIYIELYRMAQGKPFRKESISRSLSILETAGNDLAVASASNTTAGFFYAMGDYEEALRYTKISLAHKKEFQFIITADQEIFSYLVLSRFDGYEKELLWYEKKIKFCARLSSQNSQGIYDFLLAVKYKKKKQYRKSCSYFDKAVSFFEKQEAFFLLALCETEAAETYASAEMNTMARFYKKEALYHFGLIGIKKRSTKQKTATITSLSNQTDTVTISSSDEASSFIDLISILKASQTISEERDMGRLAGKILHIVLEESGAQKGILWSTKDKKCIFSFVEDNGNLLGEKTQSVFYPETLIEKVAIFRKTIKVGVQSDIYQKESYFSTHKVLSAFAVPIMHHDHLLGVLYLEHTSNPHAFTKEIIETVKLIASQAAISMENAAFYEAYKQFVPSEFLSHLERKSLLDVQLGDRIREKMTVFFADVRGFSTMAERMDPEELFSMIAEILKILTPVISKHGGFIDKYIGDAIMALFPKDPDQAILAAVEMQRVLKEYNQNKKYPLQFGIGINTGECILGVIGGEGRLESSVFGDSVNIAARLEALNKIYKTDILITESTYRSLANKSLFFLKYEGKAELKGKDITIPVWSVIYTHS